MWEVGGKFMEDVVPYVWVEGKILRWPPKGLSADRASLKKMIPKDDWRRYSIMKIKLTHCKYFEMKQYLFVIVHFISYDCVKCWDCLFSFYYVTIIKCLFSFYYVTIYNLDFNY